MHPGVECACGVTLSVYPDWASCLTMVGIKPATFGLLIQMSNALPTELRGPVGLSM